MNINKPEIKLNFGKWVSPSFYGLAYIQRKIDPDNNTYFPDKEEYGFADAVGLTYEYLHKDGIWRFSCQNEDGQYTAYYQNVLEAEETLNKYDIK